MDDYDFDPVYADLGDLAEDRRIGIIGEMALHGKVVSFIVEDDAKADRYVQKLKDRFKIRVIQRGAGPVEGMVWVKVGERGN